jgi:hypothetical protein
VDVILYVYRHLESKPYFSVWEASKGKQKRKLAGILECKPSGTVEKVDFGVQKLVVAKRRSRFAGLLRFFEI